MRIKESWPLPGTKGHLAATPQEERKAKMPRQLAGRAVFKGEIEANKWRERGSRKPE